MKKGSITSRELIINMAKEAEVVFVMEPALIDGSLKTWRKGVGGSDIKVKGRASHAGGDHEKGRTTPLKKWCISCLPFKN